MLKLNFGCGSIQPEGWTNFDSDPEFQADSTMDLFLSMGKFDAIVAHCSLQMNDWHHLPDVLKQLHNLLTSRGVIRISLPDVNKGFEAYKEGNINFFPNGEENIHIRFSAWLTWYSTTKTLLTQRALYKLLTDAGFSEVMEVRFKQTWYSTEEITELDTREGECFFMEARK